MFGKTSLGVFILAGVLVATPAGQVMAGENVEGVWACTALSGTIERPITYTFNSDGTFNYSSATTINSAAGPLQNTGFHSRGGGRGQWATVTKDKDIFNFTAVEFVYDANGNAAGSYSVDATLALTSAGQLCSGRPECPDQTTDDQSRQIYI